MEDTKNLEMERKQRERRRRRRRRRIKQIIRCLVCIMILSLLILTFFSLFKILGNLFNKRSNYNKIESYYENWLESKSYNKFQDSSVETQKVTTNMTVILDAGHGGADTGTIVDSIEEKDINIQVTNKLKEILEDNGVSVILTRENDETVKLHERVNMANECDADLFISIHCNYYDKDNSIRGFEGYYYNNEAAKFYADIILQNLSRTKIPTRNVKSAGYYVLKNTNIPALLLELGFMSNVQDRINLSDDQYQTYLANAMAIGIIDALEHK